MFEVTIPEYENLMIGLQDIQFCIHSLMHRLFHTDSMVGKGFLVELCL